MRSQLQRQLMYYLPHCWLGCGCHISVRRVCNSRLDLARLLRSCSANRLAALLPCRKIGGGNGALWFVALKERDCLPPILASNLRWVYIIKWRKDTRCVYDLCVCVRTQYYSVSRDELKLMRQQITVLPVSLWIWRRGVCVWCTVILSLKVP